MTTYTYTKPLPPSVALQKRIHEARQRAADIEALIELKRIEEANAEADASLVAAKLRHQRTVDDIARRRREAADYPVDPEWRTHRAVLESEVKAWEAGKGANASQPCTKVPSTALQVITGPVAPPEHLRGLERHTVARGLRGVS